MPIEEDAPTRPLNPYGASKLAVDRMLEEAAAQHGIAAVSLRYFNVAGAYAGLGERHEPETHLIPLILRAALEGRPADIFGDDYPTPDGTCIRDYIHVVDIADAHLLALGAASPGTWRVYNLGNGEGFSVRQVIAAARSVTGLQLTERVTSRRTGDPAVLVASSERARRELGWDPRQAESSTRWSMTPGTSSSDGKDEMSAPVPSGEDFRRVFGRPPEGIWSAPGRVNLIGEFTDYNDGFVLPLALPFAAQACAARRDDDLVRVASAQRSEGGESRSSRPRWTC